MIAMARRGGRLFFDIVDLTVWDIVDLTVWPTRLSARSC
jgi:hypothetical protein